MKSGWRKKRLGELCRLISGQHIDSSNYNTEGRGIGYLTGPSDFGPVRPIVSKWTEHPKVTAVAGDILITVKGSGVGSINRLDETEVAISRQLMAVRVTGAEPRFVHAFLTSTFDYFQSLATGAAIPGISREQVLGLEIGLPPLRDQQRIVGVLDEAFAGLATAQAIIERNLQNARALFESQLQSVFKERGSNWAVSTVGEVCTLKSGTTVNASLEVPAGEIPYLKVADMTIDGNEEVITTSSRFLKGASAKENSVIAAGATIFPKRGGAILTNKKRITSVPICADLNIMAVIPSIKLDPLFLHYYFLNIDMKKLGTGSSIPQINNYDIAPLVIAFPQELSEQRCVANSLQTLRSETKHLESLFRQKQVALAALRKSLLHQAFSGAL